ncbi:ComF family protein [Nostoc ellipsosporum NOK]|nr:ComF family protein [Nostoc ellipsosporum NOK]
MNFPQLSQWRENLLHVFFPHNCSGCGSDQLDPDGHLCLNCLSDLPYTRFEEWQDNPVMNKFTGRLKITAATSMLYFGRHSLTQQLMHRLKYRNDQPLGRQLGVLMGKKLAGSPHFEHIDVLVPLPLHRSRERQRGYNQSLLLCEGIRQRWNKNIEERCVRRPEATQTQTRMDRLERWENMEGRFVASPGHCQGKNILLVDDVVTTGATLEACGTVLLAAGAASVSFATLCYAAERL